MSHTTPNINETQPCKCEKRESVPFLDTECRIKDNKISTNLYKKPTDKNQYLLTSSCHPAENVENIPYSLALRITRICSEVNEREQAYKELKEMLLHREYTPKLVDAAIARARDIPRHVTLREVSGQISNTRPVFVVRYDPRLPKIPNIVIKHWRAMKCQDNYLEEVFQEPPLVAYSRNKNIKDTLIRAKLNKNTRQQRKSHGMKKCGKCKACSYILEGKTVKTNKLNWRINREVNCESSNVIYLVECDKDKCKKKYIGETERCFRERIYEHIKYARNKNLSYATGEHFNLPGHSWQNMKFTVIKKVKENNVIYRQEREKFFIRKFNTFYNGLNKKP